MADKSASICFSLWNEQAEAIEAGDILKLIKGLIKRLIVVHSVQSCAYMHMYMCVDVIPFVVKARHLTVSDFLIKV